MPTIILDEKLGIDRNKMINYLDLNGTPARPFFYPVSSCPEFEKISNNILSIQLGKNGINLPSYFDMTNEDIKQVSSNIIRYLNNDR